MEEVIQLTEEDVKDIEEVRVLHFSFEIKKGQERCESILKERQHLYQVRTYYAFFLLYHDINDSLKQHLIVYNQAPYYFENTSYMLDNIQTSFEKKGRDLVPLIESKYLDYKGEKNGFYYICLALICRIQEKIDESYEYLISKVDDYKDQPFVQTWFFHQLGCHFQKLTNLGEDEDDENVQNTLNYFEKALEIQPRSTMNIQNIGVQYYRMGNQYGLDKAIEYFTRSLQIYPEDNYALANLSNVYLDKQQYEKCFEILFKCFQNLQFPFILYQLQSLIINNYSSITIEDFDSLFLQLFQGLEKVVRIEASNYSTFVCFQNLQILTIQHRSQYKYIDQFDSVISQFRQQNPFSLIELKNMDLEDQEEGEELHFQYPIQLIVFKLINKQMHIIQQILSLITYERIIQPNIYFQQSFSHWDLLIDL